MSFSGWLIASAVFVLILIIAIGIGWLIRNYVHPAGEPKNKYTTPLVWGNPIPGPNPDKNYCQLYQFPTSLVTIGDETGIVVPGAPTFNDKILDNLQGNPIYPRCLDSDQIMAQQVQHGCTAPEGLLDDSIVRCFLLTGGTTGLGGTESYYTNSGCFNVQECAGQISVISANFHAPTIPNIYCLQKEGTGRNITMQPCDPSNENQLFRVTRINPGQNPNSLQPGLAQNGLIAQILDRETGLCVIPGNATTNTIYNPSYINPINNGCSGPQRNIVGTNVILGACTGGARGAAGYVWGLIPSLPYCGITGGCTGSEYTTTPQQITYVGNLNFNDFPMGNTGYQGFTGPSAIIKWLINNNAESLFYGGSGSGLILQDIATDSTVCEQIAYTSQYINLTTYNTIVNQLVCSAQNTPTIPSCIF